LRAYIKKKIGEHLHGGASLTPKSQSNKRVFFTAMVEGERHMVHSIDKKNPSSMWGEVLSNTKPKKKTLGLVSHNNSLHVLPWTRPIGGGYF
jgi:hypothetical protein